MSRFTEMCKKRTSVVSVCVTLASSFLYSVPPRAQTKNTVDVSLSLTGSTFTKGNPIHLHVVIHNGADSVLWVQSQRPASLAPFVITSPEGKPVLPRQSFKPGTRLSNMSSGISKDESHSEVFDLHKWFTVDEDGSYSVRYELKDADGHAIRSNTLSFVIIEQ